MTPQEDDRKKYLRAGFKLGFGVTTKAANFEACQHLSDEEVARQSARVLLEALAGTLVRP